MVAVIRRRPSSLARKLLVVLGKYVTAGVVIEALRQSDRVYGKDSRSGPTNAQQEPSDYLLVRIAAAALELILLHSPLSEGYSLFFGLSLILRKLHPFADDLSARLVFFHFLSLGLNFFLFSHHIREFNVGFESFWILRLAKHTPTMNNSKTASRDPAAVGTRT
jgi:hypothetical protein